jgi:hypothetical protein
MISIVELSAVTTYLRTMFLVLAVSARIGPALAASADKTPTDESAVTAKIDSDRDGTVTLDEAKTAATAKVAGLLIP